MARLDRAGIADIAIADRVLALAVARHKSIFFPEKTAAGESIDYTAAVSGGLQLVPSDKALASLSLDYAGMLDDGLLMGDAEPFETLLERCLDSETRVNKVIRATHGQPATLVRSGCEVRATGMGDGSVSVAAGAARHRTPRRRDEPTQRTVLNFAPQGS